MFWAQARDITLQIKLHKNYLKKSQITVSRISPS